ncbi:peptidase inhibitor 16 [Pangasianodon hypophthalmus]|uniref:peptidase inhibitor 16 n=1 Tax=Pangasianodon hypophthalmus TaxID=310915 RepID=UPI000EFDFFD2|nr:peptidase inhibitor 16 [Pangasianodon hypophthalmus]
MIWKTALNYARFWLVLALVSGQLTAEQKEQILDLHNRYRSMVSPEAANMLHMRWDEGLSLVAQHYAAQCIWEHNYDVLNQLGENLFLTTGLLSINKSIARWFEERKYYNYANNTCSLVMCGHYTQLVWAKSNTVGCASHFCKTVQNRDDENATILACNYFPQGNIEGELPYEAGEPCSKCPQEMVECLENSCAQIERTTEESSTDTWATDTPQMEPVDSAGFIKLSVATLLLAGLMASFIF